MVTSCTNSDSLYNTVLEKDIQGREIDFHITYPVNNLNTYKDSLDVTGYVTDKIKQLKKVEVSINQNGYQELILDEKLNFSKNIPVQAGKNIICGKITTQVDGVFQKCTTFYKSIERLEDLKFAIKSGACVFYSADNKDRIYCIGGENEHEVISQKMQIYDFDSNTWQSQSIEIEGQDGLRGRKFHAVTLIGNRIYIVFGLNHKDLPLVPDNPITSKNDAETHFYYEIVNNNDLTNNKFYAIDFVEIEGIPDPGAYIRVALGAIGIEEQIYAIGGGAGLPFLNYGLKKNTFVYSQNTGKWGEVANLNIGRGGFVTLKNEFSIYVIGGYGALSEHNEDMLDSVEILDTENPDQWIFSPKLNTPRFLGAGAKINGSFYAMGGINFQKKVEIIEKMNMNTREWNIIGISDLLFNEAAYCSDGKSLFIIGGAGKKDSKKTFFRYTPHE